MFALLLLGSFLVIAYLAASYAVYDTLSATTGECHPDDAANTPQQFSARASTPPTRRPYAMPAPQDVTFHSRDPNIAGLALRGWWIPGRTAAGPSVILVHGLKSCRRDANVLMPARHAPRHGFGVLLIDLRDHGDSDDEDLRFAGGSEEYLDVLGAWDWLARAGRAGGPDRDPRDVVRRRDDRHRRRRGARRAGRVGGLVASPRMDEAIRDYLAPRGLSRRSSAPGGRARGAGSRRATT